MKTATDELFRLSNKMLTEVIESIRAADYHLRLMQASKARTKVLIFMGSSLNVRTSGGGRVIHVVVVN